MINKLQNLVDKIGRIKNFKENYQDLWERYPFVSIFFQNCQFDKKINSLTYLACERNQEFTRLDSLIRENLLDGDFYFLCPQKENFVKSQNLRNDLERVMFYSITGMVPESELSQYKTALKFTLEDQLKILEGSNKWLNEGMTSEKVDLLNKLRRNELLAKTSSLPSSTRFL